MVSTARGNLTLLVCCPDVGMKYDAQNACRIFWNHIVSVAVYACRTHQVIVCGSYCVW